MERNDRVYILHAIDAAEKAVDISEKLERCDLDLNEIYALALVRLLEIIGEAANLVSKEFKAEYQDVPWSHMISMRNRLIHGYFDINNDIVWDTIKSDIPPLIKILKEVKYHSK